MNCIDGVMVSMLASSAVDREFKSHSGQPKDYKIGICCYSPIKHSIKEQILLGSESEYVFVLFGLEQSGDIIIISLNVTCSCHDIAEKLLIWR